MILLTARSLWLTLIVSDNVDHPSCSQLPSSSQPPPISLFLTINSDQYHQSDYEKQKLWSDSQNHQMGVVGLGSEKLGVREPARVVRGCHLQGGGNMLP